jgi:hypothetical protein
MWKRVRRYTALVAAILPAFLPTSPRAGAAPPLVTGRAAARDMVTALGRIKMINYYPARHGWAYMWTQWDPAEIDADFARISALHFNVVRVFIPPYTFGYPTPDPVELTRLGQLLTLASNHGLRVALSLFDRWGNYRDLTGSRQWAAALLPNKGARRVAFVELRNEIDPTDAQAMAWARQLLPYVRDAAGGIPVTLSASGQAGLSGLQDLVAGLRAVPPDFYSFHFYGPAPLAYVTFRQAQQFVGPAPLFIGETGYSTCPCSSSSPASAKAQEANQDHYYRTVEYATRVLGLPPAAPWTLNDFAAGAIPDPAPRLAEYAYGILRLDGTLKPVAVTLHTFLGNGSLDTGFNNGFEESYAAGQVRLPTEWGIAGASAGHFALDTTVAHSGQASARLGMTAGAGSAAPAYVISPIAPLLPGQRYRASAWARGRDATGATRLALFWFNASGQPVAVTASGALPPGTTPWQLLSVTASVPPAAAYVEIHLESALNSGTVWFDDVALVVLRRRNDRSDGAQGARLQHTRSSSQRAASTTQRSG